VVVGFVVWRDFFIFFQRLIVERDSLRETNEELKCSQLQGGKCASGKNLLAETDSENMIPPEIKYLNIIIIWTYNLELLGIAYNHWDQIFLQGKIGAARTWEQDVTAEPAWSRWRKIIGCSVIIRWIYAESKPVLHGKQVGNFDNLLLWCVKGAFFFCI